MFIELMLYKHYLMVMIKLRLLMINIIIIKYYY